MPRDDEVRVGGEAVLADARADHRRARRATGSAAPRRRAPAPPARSDGRRSSESGSISIARAVGRDLHPEPAEVAVAVERRVVVAEARACRAHEPSTPRKNTSRREICSSTRSGKSFGSHAPQAQTTTSAVGWVGRLEPPLVEATPSRRRLGEELRRPAARGGRRRRARRAPTSSSSPPSDGYSAARLLGREPLAAGSPSRASVASRLVVKPVAAARTTRRRPARRGATPRLVLELAPELERAPREPRVPLGVAVREAQQARVAARAGADVARRVLLDERHVPAAPRELARGRGAEDAGSDDDGSFIRWA